VLCGAFAQTPAQTVFIAPANRAGTRSVRVAFVQARLALALAQLPEAGTMEQIPARYR
jgi:hypothetical protein